MRRLRTHTRASTPKGALRSQVWGGRGPRRHYTSASTNCCHKNMHRRGPHARLKDRAGKTHAAMHVRTCREGIGVTLHAKMHLGHEGFEVRLRPHNLAAVNHSRSCLSINAKERVDVRDDSVGGRRCGAARQPCVGVVHCTLCRVLLLKRRHTGGRGRGGAVAGRGGGGRHITPLLPAPLAAHLVVVAEPNDDLRAPLRLRDVGTTDGNENGKGRLGARDEGHETRMGGMGVVFERRLNRTSCTPTAMRRSQCLMGLITSRSASRGLPFFWHIT